MPEQLWFTALLNHLFAGPVTAFLRALSIEPRYPQAPIPNSLAMELLVFVFLIVLFLLLRSRLSVDNPGGLQHLFEAVDGFIKNQSNEIIGGHHNERYTPFLATMTAGATRVTLLTGLWVVATVGSVLKLVFPQRHDNLAVLTYLLMGWIPLLILAPLYELAAPSVIALLAVGGALYTIGIVFHLWEALPYHKAIWHGMVLAAASVHYGAVLLGIAMFAG